MSGKKHLKSGFLLTGGTIASAIFTVIRNLVIARLVSVEDFGIAATFGMTMALIQMLSYLAVDRLIIQASDGETPRLQASAQAFQAIRGFFGMLILFSVAGPVANLFGIPEVAWAYQLIALVPLIGGFAHMDIARLQRKMKFAPMVSVDIGTQIFGTILAVPLALYLEDYRAMVWLALIQTLFSTLLTHWLAERKYEWAWDKGFLIRMYRFGWPLMLNGVLMFFMFQGDRFLIGTFFDMKTLGLFSAAFSVTLAPSMIIIKVCNSFILPLLSQVQNDPENFRRKSRQTLQFTLLVGCLLAIAFTTIAPTIFNFLFGDRYEGGAIYLVWLGVMQGFRVAKSGPIIVGMAMAETKIPLYANTVRSSALLLALIALYFDSGIIGILASSVAGEFAAYIAASVLIKRRITYNLGMSKLPVFTVISVMFVILFLGNEFFGVFPAHFELAAGFIILTAAFSVCLVAMPELTQIFKIILVEHDNRTKASIMARMRIPFGKK